MKTFVGLGLAALLLGSGCNAKDPEDPTGGADAGGAAAGGAGEGAASDGGAGVGGDNLQWSAIITADWELDPGSEKTSDIHTVTLDRDVYIGAIRPIAPTGTHHTVLAIGDLGAGHIIYASGVGTNPIYFPDHVGLKVAAGQTLVLQLHLFNPTGEAISGTSGIEIVEIAPEDVESEADLFLPGPFDFSIPPNQEYTHASTCTVGAEQHLFAVFPHMHQLGKHLKTTLTVGGQPMVIHDGDYDFNHQAFIPFDTVTLEPGDSIETACTWDNTTSSTVQWGESTTTEMCFSILYRYPAQDDGGFCGQ